MMTLIILTTPLKSSAMLWNSTDDGSAKLSTYSRVVPSREVAVSSKRSLLLPDDGDYGKILKEKKYFKIMDWVAQSLRLNRVLAASDHFW